MNCGRFSKCPHQELALVRGRAPISGGALASMKVAHGMVSLKRSAEISGVQKVIKKPASVTRVDIKQNARTGVSLRTLLAKCREPRLLLPEVIAWE